MGTYDEERAKDRGSSGNSYDGSPYDKRSYDIYMYEKTAADFKRNSSTPDYQHSEHNTPSYSSSYNAGSANPLTPEQLLKKSNDARFALKSMAYITGILSFLLILLASVGFVLMDITRSSINGQNATKYTTWSIIAFAFFFVMFKVYNGKHKALKKRFDS